MAKPVAARGFARERVVEAALELFAAHGIHGTSIQMIAARLGVTKASVYYQFQSKDDIVMAVAQPLIDDVDHIKRVADMLPAPQTRRDVALSGLIDLVIRHRRVANVIYGDPVMVGLIESNYSLQQAANGFFGLLLSPESTQTELVSMTLLTAGIYGCASDARLSEVSDDDLRTVLTDVVTRFTSAM